MRLINKLALSSVSILAISAPAFAQSADDAAEPEARDEIVVTGTLIRGIAPVGNNIIGIGEQKIAESGASSSGELLAKLPQIGYFGTVPYGVSAQVGSNSSNPISRPQLRNLPYSQTSGGAHTLVLIDGHRMVGAGTQQIGVDPDVIAPGAVQRVEALTDGGSAVYGSDAMGGVINFITRKRFDGLEANARVGLGRDITSFDGYVTAGKDWGTGGLYVSYNYSHHDEIYGRDRDYIQRIDWNTNQVLGANCAAPAVTSNGTSYIVSGGALVPGTAAKCDPSDDVTYFPRATTHNVYARLNQDLSDWLSFDVTALWARRDTLTNAGTLGQASFQSATAGSVTLQPGNPYYLPGGPAGFSQTVAFDYSPVAGSASMPRRTVLNTFQVVPQLTFKVGGDWQVRALFSYGRSKIDYANRAVSSAAQTAYLGVTVNPYDLTGPTTNAADLAKILALDTGYGRNELYDYRLIADGTLFDLPAGPVKVAFGGEHTRTNFQSQASNASAAGFTRGAINSYTQTVVSLFGEAQIPLFGGDVAFPGMEELTFSVSGRYDKYNDFGSTFNPKFGLTWKPVPWFTVRGNWGKSFTAPSPTDQVGRFTAQALALGNFALNPRPQSVPGAHGYGEPAFDDANEVPIILLNGSAPNLSPQRSTNWSVSGTIEPPFVPGLQLNLGYYHIHVDGVLARPVGSTNDTFYVAFPQLYGFRPSGQWVQDYLANSGVQNILFGTLCNPTSSAQAVISASGTCGADAKLVSMLMDTRARNMGSAAVSGLDFSVNYQRDTGFGSIDAGFAGNLRLKQETNSGGVINDELMDSNPTLRFQTTLGANIGSFRVQGTWSHLGGYNRKGGASAANFGQARVGAFNTFDLFMKYDFQSEGVFKDLTISLNIQNLLDTDPPVYKSNGVGTPGFDPTMNFTLGRYFQLGLRKKF